MPVEAGETLEMCPLSSNLLLVLEVALVARSGFLRCADNQAFAVIQRQPGFPLRIGKCRSVGLEERTQHRQAFDKVGIAFSDCRDRRRPSQRPGHVTHQMNHGIAPLDVAVKHVERFGAGCDEVFLHLDSDVVALEIVVQCVSITSELRAHGGQENLYGCQRPSFNQLGLWTLTPAGLSVAGQRFGIAGEVLSGPEDAAAFCRYLVVPVSFYDVPFDDYRALGFPGADEWEEYEHDAILGEEFRRHRSPEVARALNPALQSFDLWLSGNASRIPLG